MQPGELTENRFGSQRIVCSDADASLWLVDVAADAGALSEAALALSSDEIDRASQFRRAEDRARFVRTRSVLRRLLGAATGRAAQSLAFSLGPFGKPILVGRDVPHFNVSHSGALALIGISPRRPIGVDIELIGNVIGELDLAGTFFCDAEHHFLKALEGAARLEAFYAIWTCKEAVLKAFGVGITAYLKDFSVRLRPGGIDLVPEPDCFAPGLAAVRAGTLEASDGYAAAYALA